MLWQLKNGLLIPVETVSTAKNEKSNNLQCTQIAVLPLSGRELLPGTVPRRILDAALSSRASRYVSHDGCDVICLNLLDSSAPVSRPPVLYLFLQADCVQFLCEEVQPVTDALCALSCEGTSDLTIGLLLCLLMERLLEGDSEQIEHLESGITSLEDDVIANRLNKNYSKKIITLRRHLMFLKRYYMQLLDILDYVEANENGFFDQRSQRMFHLLDGRVNRLFQNVQHLQDYVTQIREAYEAEVDISLNRTMKFFTVITAIFLPLTLIAGWYGMNFDMPEYRLPFGYPIIILVSIAVVTATIAYFKRNKWF